MSSTSQIIVNRAHLYRETLRILNANSLHFITLSLLFLPLTFSASAAIQSYYYSSSSHLDVATSFDSPNLFIKAITSSPQALLSVKTLIPVIAFTLFVILPTVAGVALITNSANQAIHHNPLIFSSTLKSLLHSYLPLFSTILAGSIKLILLSLLFTLSAFGASEATKTLGSNLDQFIVSIFINTIAPYVLALAILYFLTIWGSAAPIAVLESKAGFEPLRQSANQSTEFRSHSFSIVYLSGFVIGSLMLTNSTIVQTIGSSTNWLFILQLCAICLYSSMMILLYVVANTVLYVQYKLACGEELVKTATEGDVSGGYVRVVVSDDDDKVPREPPKAEANGGFTYMTCFFMIFWSVISCVNIIGIVW